MRMDEVMVKFNNEKKRIGEVAKQRSQWTFYSSTHFVWSESRYYDHTKAQTNVKENGKHDLRVASESFVILFASHDMRRACDVNDLPQKLCITQPATSTCNNHIERKKLRNFEPIHSVYGFILCIRCVCGDCINSSECLDRLANEIWQTWRASIRANFF